MTEYRTIPVTVDGAPRRVTPEFRTIPVTKAPRITSIDMARTRLIERQVEECGIATIPAYDDMLETPTGWAFFNVNGYLGTVTEDGDVIVEDEHVEDE